MPERKQKKGTKGQPEKKAKQLGEKKLAAVRVRGDVRLSPDVRKTLDLLRMRKRHVCIVVNDEASVRGMFQLVKDYVAYGEMDEETYALLESKRKSTTPQVYHLHPPRGGYPRKGIKMSYPDGGALGNWGKDIGKLIRKML